ncbi:Hypothetical predicted protein [Paramuricea clavata]|uniref:Uncharacterized protein n=1 Tax=Paramuricea clavata TaxID=317549 RepID=A0A6S7I4U1_PARCT|nr:Hypothetical predicted protein [Paramuricea clavata]
MYSQREIINKLIKTRNIKIVLILQSFITTIAIIYMMIQTSNLDQISILEERANAGCQGCCTMRRESLDAITSEPQLSEKLHKISRAIRNYEIPDYILKILHEGERKLEEFENELERLKQIDLNRLSKLQEFFIEEDTTTDQDLIPKSKPKWNQKRLYSDSSWEKKS